MGALLFLALGYWWLENLAHEIFGTALFLLLAVHIYQNRNWFRNLVRGRYGLRRTVVTVFHFALIANMVVLLLTSLAVSRSLLSWLSLPDGPLVSEIHWFSAYWVVVAVGVHVGMHWSRVMAFTLSILRLPKAGSIEGWILRLTALAIAGIGIASVPVLGIITKLSFGHSLDFWDFNVSIAPFFVRWACVLGLAAIVTHYGLLLTRRRPRFPSRTYE